MREDSPLKILPPASKLVWMVGAKYKGIEDITSPWLFHEGVLYMREKSSVEELEKSYPLFIWKKDTRVYPQLVPFYRDVSRDECGDFLHSGSIKNLKRAIGIPVDDTMGSDEEDDVEGVGGPPPKRIRIFNLPTKQYPKIVVTGGAGDRYKVTINTPDEVTTHEVYPGQLRRAIQNYRQCSTPEHL